MASNLPSLGSQLDSARAKIRRANKHIQALKASMHRFGRRDLYENGAKTYDPGFAYLPSRVIRVPARTVTTRWGVHVIQPASERHLFKTFDLVITLTPKSDFSAQYLRWGVLVGEIVHNIGSALDNLVWELAQPLPAPPPATASSKVRSTHRRHLLELGFPYTKKDTDWSGNCAKYLYFVPDTAIRAKLQEAQAFYAWQHLGTDPDAFPLEVVHELWNRDKHRTVNVATTGAQLKVMNLRIPSLFPGVDNLPSKVVKLLPLRPVEGETEMAIVRVEFPDEIDFPPSGDLEMTVYVQPQFTLAILFGQGAAGEGMNVLDCLQGARDLAVQTINQFA